MELFFLALLILLMIAALGSGYPVAFALPGSAIITILLAAIAGYLLTGNVDSYFAHGGPGQWLTAGITNLRGVYWEVERDTLIAIPLFIFMGILLQQSKIAEDLLVSMAQLFGPVPGGLGISVVFVGALLAATTGIVGATVVAMGLISLPAMLKNGYAPSLATGTIAASGTLGQIIPPSIVLIILADQLTSASDQASTLRKTLYKEATGDNFMPSTFDVVSTSAGEMFLGAFVPGLVLVGLYMLYIFVFALIRPKAAPAVPYEGKYDRQFYGRTLINLVPPLVLIFLVLGSIITGIATVNQAGAIGAAGALIMAGYRLFPGGKQTFTPAIICVSCLIALAFLLSNYEINIKKITSSQDGFIVMLAILAVTGLLIGLIWSGWRVYKNEKILELVMVETAKTTALVFIILLGAAMLTAAFRAFGGEEIVREFLTSLPGGFWSQFVIVMAVIFFLGFFLDFIEIAVVVVPIVAPILLADPSANITAVWLGVMIGLNIQTSFLTPPFGFALFYLRGVAPKIVKTIQIYKGVAIFILLQIIALFIVGFYPALVNYLPNRVALTSETAPPPRNPRLQYCLEEFTANQFANTTLRQQIARELASLKELDYTMLPAKYKKQFTAMLDATHQIYPQLQIIKEQETLLTQAAIDYRPLHRQTRAIEKQIRHIDQKIKPLERRINYLNQQTEAQAIAKDKLTVEELQAEKQLLLARISPRWEQAHKEFVVLQKQEENTRKKYRTLSEQVYAPLQELITLFENNKKLAILEQRLLADNKDIPGIKPAIMADRLKILARDLRNAQAGTKAEKAVNKARKQLKGKKVNLEKAQDYMDKALKELQKNKQWRLKAEQSLGTPVRQFEQLIRHNIGARLQPELTREQALFIAGCNAGHRDISLSF